ncbi:hypothetical protein EV182_000201 [Spiromyces aspiralis]|uniref:Uncharacterized protein n=1 Tax=Spiromyces aspiralis TaxID=68401 RepID=A0ACC1HVH0_9FUNG|nr:hypothetical protein EV182_000201 [Spiromyces aspiralis]
MSVSIFKDKLMKASELCDHLLEAFVQSVEGERNGAAVNRRILRGIVDMYIEMGLYFAYLSPALVKETRRYYREEGQHLDRALTLPASTANVGASSSSPRVDVPYVLRHAETRIREERERADAYLDPKLKRHLIDEVQTMLISAHVTRILDLGFDAMMKQMSEEDLSRLYSLFRAIEKLDVLRMYWTVYIKTVGTAIVKNPENDDTLVESLLDLKQRLDRILANCMGSDPAFHHALKEAFESFINTRQGRPTRLIAKFLDRYLRSDNAEISDQSVNILLNRVLVLFRYIRGKDMFEAYYKQGLSRRLIHGTSASKDIELLVLSKLKNECGEGFTSRLEGMLKDIDISRDFAEKFSKSKAYKGAKVEFGPLTINKKYWPTYKPEKLEATSAAYEKYYCKEHDHRKLAWLSQLGTAVVAANYPAGPKEFEVTEYQALVLEAFNDQQSHSFGELRDTLGINGEDLSRTLMSLSRHDMPVLRKLTSGGSATKDDEFIANTEFTHADTRIRLFEIEGESESKDANRAEEKVHLDRTYKIDAAIVRTMKVHKQLSHTELINKLLGQIKFTIPELKGRIESVINRDFIERDEDNPSLLVFVP